MATDKAPTIIKKYANRRLYHTGSSAYVTLEDLAGMVKGGEDFQVFDAKTNEDITRSVLAQIIFEQEGKAGQNLLPVTFLRQLIRFYGHSLQALVPSYLEFSMENLAREQQKLRDQMNHTFGPAAFGVEDQVRANMAFFTQAMSLFSPFAAAHAEAKRNGGSGPPAPEPGATNDLDVLRTQMADMQAKLEELSRKT